MKSPSLRFRALAVGAVVPTLFVGLMGAAPAQADTSSTSIAAADAADVMSVNFTSVPRVGQTVAVRADGIPDNATLKYEWTVTGPDGADAPGTGSVSDSMQYTPVPADAGLFVSVKVTASGDDGSQTSSTASQIVQLGYQNQPDPNISGNEQLHVGQPVSVDVPANQNAHVTYRWAHMTPEMDGWEEVPNTDSPTFTPTLSNTYVAVFLTYTAKGYEDYNIGWIVGKTEVYGDLSARITGTPKVNEVLTAEADSVPEGASLSYQWMSSYDFEGGGSFFYKIDGATSKTFLVDGFYSGRNIQVFIEAKHNGQEITEWSSATAGPVAKAVMNAPEYKMGGVSKVGSTLDVSTDDPSHAYNPATYQWFTYTDDPEVETPIDGATESSYLVSADDYGKHVGVNVTTTSTGYEDDVQKIDGGVVDLGTLDVNYDVYGSFRSGNTLMVSPDAPLPNGATSEFQWYQQVGDARIPIGGATSNRYLVRPADINKNIGVTVTTTRPAYATKVQSLGGHNVAPEQFDGVPDVNVSGDVAVNSSVNATLDGTQSLPSDTTIAYQWRLTHPNGETEVIDGATSAAFTPAPSHVGKGLYVTVKFSKDGYETETVVAEAGEVAPGDLDLKAADVTVAGSAQVGGMLTAAHEAEADESISVSYQWVRYLTGGETEDIAGATADKYMPVEADRTDSGVEGVGVNVTYAKDGYVSKTFKSDVTKVAPKPAVEEPVVPPAVTTPVEKPVVQPTPPAKAADYVKVNDKTMRRGQKVHVTSKISKPGTKFKIVIAGRTVKTGKVRSNGLISNWVTVPKGASKGRHKIRVIEYNSKGKRVGSAQLTIRVR